MDGEEEILQEILAELHILKMAVGELGRTTPIIRRPIGIDEVCRILGKAMEVRK